MKIQNRQKNRKKLVVLLLVTAILLAAAASAVTFTDFLNPRDNQKPQDRDTKEKSPEETEKESADSRDAATNNAKDPSASDETPEKPASDELLSITPSPYINGRTFNIRTSLSTITNSGTCSLTMKNGRGKSYTAQADVQALPSSSTCKGFDVPMSALGSGTWTITIKYQNGSISSTATKEVVINA